MTIYRDPIIKKYFDLIEGIVGVGTFKRFYYGDPIRIPISNLPALIISKDETGVGNITNVEDQHLMSLILTVVTDIRDDISDDKTMAPGTNRLYEIIEGREASTLKLQTKSILHILRNNLDVDISLGLKTNLGSVTRVDYGLTVGKRDKEAWSTEAQVGFIAEFTQLR